MKVLLVGLGRWGAQHLRVLTALGATVWVADVVPARRQWAIDHGVPPARVREDYRDALAQVDAVDIVTPADSHAGIAATALRAGRHCFIEKPLAPSIEECRVIVAAADAAGRVVQTGHVFRFHPVTRAVREALQDERLGRLRYASGRFSGFRRPRTDVGVTHTDAIHYFDLFAHLLGVPAVTVSAVQRDFLGRGLDDLSVSVVTYGDVPAVIEANYFAPGRSRECLLVGERGALVADYDAGMVTVHGGTHVRRDGGWEAVDTGKESLPVSGDEALRVELQTFVDACARGGGSAVDARAGLHAVEIAEAAARSARLGRVVELGELVAG